MLQLQLRSLERRPVVAAFAALAGVAAVATVVLAIGLLANTKAHPGAGGLGLGAVGSGSAGSTASASDGGTFPNAAEQALLARIDPSLARLCQRAGTSEYPVLDESSFTIVNGRFALVPGTHRSEPLPVEAGLKCRPDEPAPDSLFLWMVRPKFNGDRTVERYLFIRMNAAHAPAGDCSSDDRAYMHWSYGLRSGNLLCVTTSDSAHFDWIFDGEDVIASAERHDSDRAALYQWWLDAGRVILH